MISKTFIGEVVESRLNEWVNESKGEQITCWKIALSLTDELGIVFNVGKDHPEFEKASCVSEGERVKVIAHKEVRNDGRVTWKLDEVQPAE